MTTVTTDSHDKREGALERESVGKFNARLRNQGEATPRSGIWGNCTVCNGYHDQAQCPKRLLIKGRYYRLLSVAEFAKRRRTALRKMNRDVDNAWQDLERVSLWCSDTKTMLPISSAPYIGRMFVECLR